MSDARTISAIVRDGRDHWLVFGEPECVLASDTSDGLRGLISDVEGLTREPGLHAVGFVTYEAGRAFGLAVRDPESRMPAGWFALFRPSQVTRVRELPPGSGYQAGPLRPSLDRPTFSAAFEQIRQHIADGDSYQVNYTFKLTGPFSGSPEGFFQDLAAAQQGRYSAFIRFGDLAICSASPELFFEIDGLGLVAQPMKGTSARGRTPAEDRERRDILVDSPKQRAENVMIVDMMRNDLGRVAEVGSVAVPELFAVERYPTLWQMTSRVTARSMAPLADIFAALHPSASVTGAPKVRTMEILAGLETTPRGLYTGAIGHVPPTGNARFSVAIRTAVIDLKEQQLEFGVGSGIVWDSDPGEEYEECLLKARILTPPVAFELLETLRWTPGAGYLVRQRHLDRMRESAEYFDYPCDVDRLSEALDQIVKDAASVQRVRLLLARDGAVRCERRDLDPASTPVRIGLATEPIDDREVWLFHKTTHRQIYEAARQASPAVDDVVLWNQRGEVTETTTANLVIEWQGRRVTPPVESGLLAGTFRAELLARGTIVERVVTLDEFRAAPQRWLINSVHEWRAAALD